MIKLNDENNLRDIAMKIWNIQIKWIPKKEKTLKLDNKNYQLLLHVKLLQQFTKNKEQKQKIARLGLSMQFTT